jgi:hypothetical protein
LGLDLSSSPFFFHNKFARLKKEANSSFKTAKNLKTGGEKDERRGISL